MKNGHDDRDPKVASLDEARRRAEQARREAARKEAGGGRAARRQAGPARARDWIIGGVLIAMAVGAVWAFVAPMLGSSFAVTR